MREDKRPDVAIVDHGLGNLFSVRAACEQVGARTVISADRDVLMSAGAVILPGVGAFGDAMETLRKLDLIDPLRRLAAAGRPLMGVCLGQQLLMSRSEEFGDHDGLGIVPGHVQRFPSRAEGGEKVPHVGWNTIRQTRSQAWNGSPLSGLPDPAHMYFVHSYHIAPRDPACVVSETTYANVTFASSIQVGSVFAAQFHPERSGPYGLSIYRNFISHRIPRTEEDING